MNIYTYPKNQAGQYAGYTIFVSTTAVQPSKQNKPFWWDDSAAQEVYFVQMLHLDEIYPHHDIVSRYHISNWKIQFLMLSKNFHNESFPFAKNSTETFRIEEVLTFREFLGFFDEHSDI